MSLKLLPLVHVLLAALGGVVAFASNPDYYIWLLLPAAFFAVAYKVVSSGNRKVLTISFVVIGLYSFAIGRMFYGGDALTDDGLVLLIATLPIAAFVIIRICVVEARRTTGA